MIHKKDDERINKSLVNWEQEANMRSALHLSLYALKACLDHFQSEPTDPGHPELLVITKQALEEIKRITK